jgi:eukaryotic-like serine/threonine-protein kinase
MSPSEKSMSALEKTVREEGAVVSAEPSGKPQPGDRVGPFRLFELLGQGGMGTVFLAEQLEPVRRKVALKLLEGSLEEPGQLARFAIEKQALARMSHPAIAQVYDAGATAEGRPYLAMEHVPGAPMTRYCKEKRLGLRQRLELFVRVCWGVQHAHQKGIIHRDLKPSNILVAEVDGRPMPKIIDFGIATTCRAPSERRRRSEGVPDFAGTPQYMSPEQVDGSDGDLDTRSDVYSLGAVLYELLTGATPIDPGTASRATRDELRHLVHHIPVLPPSERLALEEARELAPTDPKHRRLVRLVRSEVDWIALTALAHDRTLRYSSAAALAQDLEAFLAGRPVQAVPSTLVYRLRKLAAQYRVLFVAGTAAAIALAAGLALSTWGFLQARDQRDRALEAERLAFLEAAKSERIAAFTQEMLSGVDPAEAGALDKTLMRRILEGAAAKLDTELTGQPEVAAAIHRTIGTTYRALGEYTPAVEHLTKAVALQEESLGRSAPQTLVTLSWLALAHRRQGEFELAEKLLLEAVEGLRASLGDEDEETLSAINNLASLHFWQGRFEESERLYLEAVEGSRHTLGPDHRDTLTAVNNLAFLYSEQGRAAEAEPLYLEVLERSRQTLGSDHPDTLNSLNNLAALYEVEGRLEEAEALYLEAVAGSERVLGAGHPETLNLRNNLAVLYVNQGRLEEGEALHLSVLEEFRRLWGPRHPDTLNTINNLAFLYLRQERFSEAERLLADAVAVAREALPEARVLMPILLRNLATALSGLQRLADAEAALTEAHHRLEELLGPDHDRTRGAAERLEALRARLAS